MLKKIGFLVLALALLVLSFPSDVLACKKTSNVKVDGSIFCGNTSDQIDVKAKSWVPSSQKIKPIALTAYSLEEVGSRRTYGDLLN